MSHLSERAVLAQEQVPIILWGLHFSWKLEDGLDYPRNAFLGLPSRRFYHEKRIPACFNTEVRQFFTDTITTSNSRELGKMIQKVPFSPIFHHPHVSTSFSNLKFHTDGIQSRSSCQSYLLLLVLLTRSTHSQGLVLSPGYFPAFFCCGNWWQQSQACF